jgi:hypothetical protein
MPHQAMTCTTAVIAVSFPVTITMRKQASLCRRKFSSFSIYMIYRTNIRHPCYIQLALLLNRVRPDRKVYPPSAAVIGGRSRKDVIVTLIEGEGIISNRT